MLELVEEALDDVALAVELLLPAVAPRAVGLVGNVGNGALRSNVGSDPVGIITLVGDDHRLVLEIT